jgi:hypothetical protein
MKPIALMAVPLAFASQAALAAGSVQGNGALALAALVGEHSPHVKPLEKIALLRLFNGQLTTPYPANKKISVKADAISCKTSNVDITEHRCELTFGTKKIVTNGRRAHELYATLAEVGVPPDGAAGSIFEALSNLDCTIDPDEVKQKAGGGAQCGYDPAK